MKNSGTDTGRDFWQIDDDQDGRRIDNFLLSVTNLPRPLIYKLIRKGAIRTDEGKAKPSQRLISGQIVSISRAVLEREQQSAKGMTDTGRGWRNDQILHECDQYFVVDKPAGLPSQGGSRVTMSADQLCRAHGDNLRLCHRLDRGTSGVLCFAKTRVAATEFQNASRSASLDKVYIAVAWGDVNLLGRGNKMRINQPVQNKDQLVPAVSNIEVLCSVPEASLLKIRLETGRKHQIRQHLLQLGYPIVGDERYGHRNVANANKEIKMLMLHAYSMVLPNRQPVKAHLPFHFLSKVSELLRISEDEAISEIG